MHSRLAAAVAAVFLLTAALAGKGSAKKAGARKAKTKAKDSLGKIKL